MIKKKFSTDFLAKESFVWVNPACRSIHWYVSFHFTSSLIPLDSSFTE